jgi:hypothetical protein
MRVAGDDEEIWKQYNEWLSAGGYRRLAGDRAGDVVDTAREGCPAIVVE